PVLAGVEKVVHLPGEPPEDVTDFRIVKSTRGETTGLSAGIPMDTALCEDCAAEIFDPENRRYLYPFTNCTTCGARFTVTRRLPYDRANTAMAPFEMCEECRREYEDPMDRRFHAQTISCPNCGPTFTLYDRMGNRISEGGWGPLKEFANLVDAGNIGVMKTWGGMQIVSLFEKVWDLREWYRRREKPFAVMARDLYSIEAIADLKDEDRAMLVHPGRPIVLVRKKRLKPPWDEVMDGISPGLDTIGVFLPYTALHYILFYFMESDFLIVTSANRRGEPMVTDNEEIFSLNADYYLLHDRDIVNRADDSLLKTFGDNVFFIRKSRGFVPEAIRIGGRLSVMAMGAEENLTITISRDGWAYHSQYIGNAESYGVMEFGRDASRTLRRYLGVERPEVIAVDMHPKYRTRRIGERLAEKFGASLVEIQHHHAHAASLIIDSVSPRVWDHRFAFITADGTGYGPDGTAWGGEILLAGLSGYKWIGGLEQVPLIGGEKAIRYPERVAFAMLDRRGIDHPLIDDMQAEMLRRAAAGAPLSSGLGRFLDAISAYYTICVERTYNGEPAMKVEPYLVKGSLVYRFEVETVGDPPRFSTSGLLAQAVHLDPTTFSERADIIYSMVHALIDAMVERAREQIIEANLDRRIGFTGGVAYSIPIVKMFVDLAEERRLKPILHNSVPAG
ncbi:MAG TPA: carbamoyltransferase HypF, partial [Thermoplasmata archaeon]|nr:carbamoyltransferase HypF [Thermoplasmata archaeon]